MTVALNSRQVNLQTLERQARAIGRSLFEQLRGPLRLLDRSWWDDWFMDLTMGDPALKVQLFRFTDVLPALKTPEAVRAHLAEYLQEAGPHTPWWLRWPLEVAPRGPLSARLWAFFARFAALHMARRFIAGETPEQALASVLRLRRRKLAFTADLLGEAVISEAEAEAYQQSCLGLIESLAQALASAPEVEQIDRWSQGPLPRLNLSLKLTSLTARFDALHAEATQSRVLSRLRPILRLARQHGAFINIDMEQYAFKDLTHAIFQSVLSEPEFRDWSDAGIVVQAYLPEAERDLQALRDWACERGTPITVRLVKGAYWDYEVLNAQQHNWPIPVFTEKWRTDQCYERCTLFLLEHRDWLRPALGSHNIRSLAYAAAAAEQLGLPHDLYEFQMLFGMGEAIQRALVDRGHRVRVYTPYGAMLPGMAYLVRRLLENTSNESFLKASATARASPDDLLRAPEEIGAMRTRLRKPRPEAAESAPPGPFANEPHTDFSRAPARQQMREALADCARRLPFDCPLSIGGNNVRTETQLEGFDPGNHARLVSRTGKAQGREADQAVAAARSAASSWAARPARERAEVLMRAAEILRRERFPLAAVEVYECGKPWAEADADIAEAIDFCEFYAREMIRIGQEEHHDLPGETNRVEYIARGVAVVIPPWNFPLAIPTGMTAAALVAGNAVILKPAEQSPAIAWHLARILHEAGLPPGVLNYLPGLGEEVGAALVAHTGIDLVAFTGSRPVGLEINRRAAETPPGQDHVKRVIAEMGGKNAIIIDEDADLDEAIIGVLQSAFGYAGQKCSACSRAIALERVHDAFVARLVEAAKDLPVGPAEDPDTVVGPLINQEAFTRVRNYAEIARQEGQVALERLAGKLAEQGYYFGPMIVTGVHPDARIAQEEIFGPILAVLRARDLDEALQIANGTDYALTGGLYARSPAHIERVRAEFRVGNLYINRAITGALVGRQPFGGFKLSGIGTKAGGQTYLYEFLIPRTITENTMRRGFAPEVEGE